MDKFKEFFTHEAISWILSAIHDWLKSHDLKKFVDIGIDELEDVVEDHLPEILKPHKQEIMEIILIIREGLDIPDYPDKSDPNENVNPLPGF